jgi:hypothetical protein
VADETVAGRGGDDEIDAVERMRTRVVEVVNYLALGEFDADESGAPGERAKRS